MMSDNHVPPNADSYRSESDCREGEGGRGRERGKEMRTRFNASSNVPRYTEVASIHVRMC